MKFNPIQISPLPYVRLDEPEPTPYNGGVLAKNNYCSKKVKQSPECVAHYKKLAKDPALSPVGIIRQCPFGFSTYAFKLGAESVGFTCFIPFPRLGGDAERQRAKDHDEAKVSQDYLNHCAVVLAKSDASIQDAVSEHLKVYPSALHEIRKYNRTIKQEAERLCMAQSPKNLDDAPAPLVCILKASELMTYQFEILELIANEELASLPTNTRTEVYKLFDKCTRICNLTAKQKGIRLEMGGDSIQAMVSDKTFPIIATVLLENAIKYSLKNTVINVLVKRVSPAVGEVTVTNIALPPTFTNLDDYFLKWSRGKKDGSGMGFGLYLAQLVAKQHRAKISIHTQPQNGNASFHVWNFKLTLPIIAPPLH